MAEFQELIPKVLRGIYYGDALELQTERNLTVSAAIFQEMLDELLEEKKKVDEFASVLRLSQYRIDSISAEKDLYLFPSDSLQTRQYSFLLVEIAKEMKPVEDSLMKYSGKLDSIQTSLNEMVFDLNTQIESLELIRRNLNASIFEKEIPDDQGSKFHQRPLSEAISYSYTKEKLALIFYLRLYQTRLLMMAFLILISWIFIKTLKNRIGLLNEQDIHEDGKVILIHPLLSSIVIVIGCFQFFFPSPPFIFYWLIWFLASISITLIFSNFLKSFWFFFWVFTVLIFLLSGIANLILLPTAEERYLLIALSLIGILFLASTFIKNKTDQLKEKRIVYFIYFMGFFELVSLVLNLAGRFNLSKSFLVAGYIGIVVGILLLWTVRLINQGLSIATKIYHNQEKELFFINFDRLGNRAPGIFYTFLIFGWVVLVGKNFYSFSQISLSINEFLNEKRMIGSYEFSINGLFVFLIILLVSVMISRLLSIFAADPETSNSQEKRKRISFGSWLLLVQIFVISLGLFLAFAASGIPLDKITIILGALSVGIGLGLQGLVNNLVSGLILAFEKTVKVGDLIEIDGKPGIMKSIGFRSSVVSMFEGPSVVIPNGDLISKQLINWTTGKGRKLSAIIGVAYGTDLQIAVRLLREIIAEDSRIRTNPSPRVVPVEFTDSSIDIEVTFWVNTYFDYPYVKGDLISKANELFKQNGIQIPFPQLDLHVKSK
ncbi:mechanosensitive ion channel domain-containing protein [Algoriphagus sp. AK58]|uniref:mechanosensitive ion channel domain-containing protein n=1 Tax=Algoriphagus sp. AK58 TaxID=1406877 RepID=UPI0016502C43|nr:mechanosensitive ion channel domain-containing protein [Algoriphagus sp. AK58]